MADDTRGSFIRWQGITIQQLTFINNLLIGLAAGILAFQLNIVFSEYIELDCASKVLFSLSIVLIFISLAVGCSTALNRLVDFRITMRIADKREKEDLKGIESLRDKTNRLGKWTWRLLKAQIVIFSLGVILIPPLAILQIID
ncbi:MAG: hypothetical protein JXA51_01805 [Dehalococcoidales bacterium]|nr:hypothetical protein [Dehalococcoidales bacterium]